MIYSTGRCTELSVHVLTTDVWMKTSGEQCHQQLYKTKYCKRLNFGTLTNWDKPRFGHLGLFCFQNCNISKFQSQVLQHAQMLHAHFKFEIKVFHGILRCWSEETLGTSAILPEKMKVSRTVKPLNAKWVLYRKFYDKIKSRKERIKERFTQQWSIKT